MAESFIGEIGFFASDRIPTGWLPCDGRILNVSAYPGLFALFYPSFSVVGDLSQFKLPDLRGRTVIGTSYENISGPQRVISDNGSTTLNIGDTGGSETVTLNQNNLPKHTHQMEFSTLSEDKGGALLGSLLSIAKPVADATNPPSTYAAPGTAPGTLIALNQASLDSVGDGQPHENRQPYLVLLACICVEGFYPSRD